jgi:hypothetical protein
MLADHRRACRGGSRARYTHNFYVRTTGHGWVLRLLLDRGGYSLGFRALAGVTAAAAVIALGLRSRAGGAP